MPQVAPGSARSMLQTIVNDPKVRTGLSPQAYQALQSAASQGADMPIQDFVQQLKGNPELASAFQEAQQKGLLSSWLDKWGPVLGLGIVGALTAGTALIPAAGAVSSGGGAAASTLPAGSAGGNIAAGVSASGATIPGAVASGAGPFAALKNPLVLGTILGGIGTGLQAWQQNKATNAQEKAAEDALALQKEMYYQTREDLKPYREAGSAAERYRGYLLGLPGYDTPSSGAQDVTEQGTKSTMIPGIGTVQQNQIIRNPDGSVRQVNGTITQRDTSGSMPLTPEGQRPAGMAAPPGIGGAGAFVRQQGGTLASFAQGPTSGGSGGAQGMVTVRSPDGRTGQIPANRLQDALRAGGTQV